MSDLKVLTLRVPEEFQERVKILADKENRSVNKEIIELVKRGIESEATKQLNLFR